MEREQDKIRSPAPPRGDKLEHKLGSPSTVNVSEPAFACQAKTIKNCKIFSKNVTNNFKNSVNRDNTDGYISGNSNLIPNREFLVKFLEDELKISEYKKRAPDKDTYVDTAFVDRSGENKKDRNSKGQRKHKAIRRLVKVNRASDLIDYWLSMISQNPELLFWSFYIGPFLIVHDPEAPDLFEEEFYIYDEETGRSIKSKLRARYIVSCLVLDVDDVSREEIKARIEQAPVKPSYIVWSGKKGAHLYFLFDQPYEETVKFKGFKPIADKLADIFGADSGASYYKRYMRTLPYTYNSKYFPEKVIALLEKMPCLTLYFPEEIDLLVKRYFESSDDEPQNPPLIPKLETESRNRDEQLKRLESKYRGLMRRSPRFYDIMTGKAPEIKSAKSASERVYIAGLQFANHDFPKWFAKLKLTNWDFGLLNGNRAEQMREKPELAKMRLDLIIDGAYEDFKPEFRVLAIMRQNTGYSLERLCRLTGFNIAKLKHYVRILREQGKLEVKSSYRKGKLAMICRKRLNINASEKICSIYKTRGIFGEEKICAFEKKKIHAHLENNVKNSPNKVYLDPTKVYLDPKIVRSDQNKTKIDLIKNTELVSELKKLEGRKKSEIKALYWELPKTDPLIAMFEKRVSELGVTGLEKDEAFALWVLQEKAKLNQKPKFHTGFT